MMPVTITSSFDTTRQSRPCASFARWTALVVSALTLSLSGCAIRGAIPAAQLPEALRVDAREARVPIDLSLLGQPRPADHVIAPGDVLGIYIEDVFGAREQLPPVTFYPNAANPRIVAEPTIGQPVEVQANGTIYMPMIDPLYVTGLTIPQVHDRLRRIYVEERKVLRAGQERITVSLIRPRTTRVVVIRDDLGSVAPTLTNDQSRLIAGRGSAETLELPVYENDVIHALARSGGLPGLDGVDEVWIFRMNGNPNCGSICNFLQCDHSPERVNEKVDPNAKFVRLPLRIAPHESPCITPQDVILQEGDIVYVRRRDTDYFLTGGLLEGAKIPLPRDHDVDVLEAIAIANGHVDGPTQTTNNFVNGPGNIIPPSRVLIVRRWGRDQQVKIEVDIERALNDPRERILVKPGDILILKYSPGEITLNAAMNIVNFSYILNNN